MSAPAEIQDQIRDDVSVREVSVGVSVHLYLDTAISVKVHAAEGRAVVCLGRHPSPPLVDLFADRATLLRLRDLLDDAVFAIDTVRTTSQSTTSTSTTAATAGDDAAA